MATDSNQFCCNFDDEYWHRYQEQRRLRRNNNKLMRFAQYDAHNARPEFHCEDSTASTFIVDSRGSSRLSPPSLVERDDPTTTESGHESPCEKVERGGAKRSIAKQRSVARNSKPCGAKCSKPFAVERNENLDADAMGECNSAEKLMQEISETVDEGDPKLRWEQVQAPGFLNADNNTMNIFGGNETSDNETSRPFIAQSIQSYPLAFGRLKQLFRPSVESLINSLDDPEICIAFANKELKPRDIEKLYKPDDDKETLAKKINAKIKRKRRNKQLLLQKKNILGELSVNTNSNTCFSDCDSIIELNQSKNRFNIFDKENSIENLPFESSKRYSTRFTRDQSNVLKKWYEEHRGNPYASDEIIEKLSEKSGLETRSIRKWLSNKRTRLFETRTFRKRT